MKRKLALVVAIGSLAVPSIASAAAPNGAFVFNTHSNAQGCVGAAASAIIQNGQFVGSGDNLYGIDQTTYPGSRAEAVHALQATC